MSEIQNALWIFRFPKLTIQILCINLRIIIEMLGVQFHRDKPTSSHSLKRNPESTSRIKGEKSPRNQLIHQNPQQIQNLFVKQIKRAQQLANRIQSELVKQRKSVELTFLQQLREMEQSIRIKNILIRELQTELASLKGPTSAKSIKDYNPNLILSQQLSHNITAIVELRKEMKQKKNHLAYKRQQAHDTYQKYAQKCKAEMKQVINYVKFVDTFEKKRRQNFMNNKNDKLKSSNKKLLSAIGQDRRMELISNNAHIDKNLNQVKDTINHKSVAQIAIRNQKKKHKQQMNNFMSKLEFLKDQDSLLQQKIRTKELELKSAQMRFNQSRSKPDKFMQQSRRSDKLKTLI